MAVVHRENHGSDSWFSTGRPRQLFSYLLFAHSQASLVLYFTKSCAESMTASVDFIELLARINAFVEEDSVVT